MRNDPTWQWLLTALFAWTAIDSARHLECSGPLPRMVSDVFHVVMSVVMVAMCWPWWDTWPKDAQVAVVAAGALWFAMILAKDIQRDSSRLAVLWHGSTHVAMMIAMVWMIVVMPAGTDAAGAPQHAGIVGGALVMGVVLTVLLTVAAATFLVDALYSWLAAAAPDAGLSGAAMSGGMAVMCWLMLAH